MGTFNASEIAVSVFFVVLMWPLSSFVNSSQVILLSKDNWVSIQNQKILQLEHPDL